MLKTLYKNNKLISDTDLLQLSEKVVAKYVSAGTIPAKDMEDVKMAIVEKFLLKQESIKNAFSGKAKVSTYCIAILNRMCCEIIRKELKHWKNSNGDVLDVPSNITSNDEKLAIADEVELLHKILLLFGKEYCKVKLFLAFYYQLKIKDTDISNYSSKPKIVELFNNVQLKNKGEIFENLAKSVQVAESKNVKADAVRIWLNKSIDRIVKRLNGNFNRANYNKETVQILFEYFYSEQLSINNNIKKGA